ncbi:HNH endonuclease [Luteibacter sp.]|jgi:5-methylcytosine-specific restriction protein A|uniref:HNH endonuclease n=1 Tax=Luteibacter sp. TaxID=1886636 RepID=UPI0039C9CAB9
MDSHHFVVGKEYHRQALLDFVGSKQAQSGVIWGPLEPGCVICTSGGRHGKKAGYFDEPLSDGSWLYFGQGGSGDQSPSNAANSRLASGSRSVLLFTTRESTAKEIAAQGGYGKRFKFQGSYSVAAVETAIPDSGPRKGNHLLRFHFVRVEEHTSLEAIREIATQVTQASLPELQHRLNMQDQRVPAVRMGLAEYRKRSTEVRQYALLRACGICELCQNPAPFTCDGGLPYLEVHHLHRLADDGPDAPGNVAAICPNCHRAVHYAMNRLTLNMALAEAITEKEAVVSGHGSIP